MSRPVFSLAAVTVAGLLLAGAPEAGAAGPARAPGSAPAATPTPRVLVRDPVDVPPARRDEVLSAVGSALREAGALPLSTADFARVVGSRADVKVVLDGARGKVKTGLELDEQKEYADAVRSLEGAVEDFEFVGADVWLPEEVGKAYIALGFARWHRDRAAKMRVPGKTAIAAWRRGREIVPSHVPKPPEVSPADIAVFKRAAAGNPGPPDPPGEGLFSLGRLLGLDGVVEVRMTRKGALQLRAHKIEAAGAKTFRLASRARGLDAASRKMLAKGFAFPGGPIAPAVASATPVPSPAATAVAAATPTPTATALAASSPTPAPTPVATATTAPEPTPVPTVVAVATPRPTPPPRNGNGTGRTRPTPPPEATPTPIVTDPSVTPGAPAGPPSPFAGSYAQVLGGADHRAALYTTESAFSAAPSGTSPAGWIRVWYVMRDVWAISAAGGGMQRVYEVVDDGDKMKGAIGQEASLHVLRSDDARGRWWIGGGVSYVGEPKVTGPGGFPEVPQISRITPSAIGVAHFPLGGRFELRGRAVAGVAIETGKSYTTDDRSGVGYDMRVEGSAVFALTSRLRLAAGVAGQRVFTDFGDKTTAVESRRGFWLGVEAGF